MIAKEYNLEDSKQALEDYLQWECEMRRKYTYDSFADYHTMQVLMKTFRSIFLLGRISKGGQF